MLFHILKNNFTKKTKEKKTTIRINKNNKNNLITNSTQLTILYSYLS